MPHTTTSSGRRRFHPPRPPLPEPKPDPNTRPTTWCFMCASSHAWGEPCKDRRPGAGEWMLGARAALLADARLGAAVRRYAVSQHGPVSLLAPRQIDEDGEWSDWEAYGDKTAGTGDTPEAAITDALGEAEDA